MIHEPTVFILGAGASCPYGYPSGRELRREICTHFYEDYDRFILKRSKIASFVPPKLELNEARNFADKFNKSSTKSIDLFLARNPEFEILGKKAIIFRIFAAERNSAFREQMRTGGRKQDWYSYIFDRLTDDHVEKNDYRRFCENKVSFITFNYDRSLEHFLYESLVNSFNNIPLEKIKEQLVKLRIIHIFGQIAGLEWQDLDSKIEYRWDINRINVQGLVNNLRIIYEENNNPELKEAHELLRKAQHIFFLGFGYAKENLELLNIPKALKQGQNIYGTALGLTPKEIQDKKTIFPDQSPPYASLVHIEDLDCLMLLRQYL